MSVNLLPGNRLLFSNGVVRHLNPALKYTITSEYQALSNSIRFRIRSEPGIFGVTLDGVPITEHALPPSYQPPIWGRNPASWLNQPMNRIYAVLVGMFGIISLVLYGAIGVILAREAVIKKTIKANYDKISAQRAVLTKSSNDAVSASIATASSVAAAAGIGLTASTSAGAGAESKYLYVTVPANASVYPSYAVAQMLNTAPQFMYSNINTAQDLANLGPRYKVQKDSAMEGFAVTVPPNFSDTYGRGAKYLWNLIRFPLIETVFVDKTIPVSFVIYSNLYRRTLELADLIQTPYNTSLAEELFKRADSWYSALWLVSYDLKRKPTVYDSVTYRNWYSNVVKTVGIASVDAYTLIKQHISLIMNAIANNKDVFDNLIPLTCALIMRLTPPLPDASKGNSTITSIPFTILIASYRFVDPNRLVAMLPGPSMDPITGRESNVEGTVYESEIPTINLYSERTGFVPIILNDYTDDKLVPLNNAERLDYIKKITQKYVISET